MQLAAVFGGSLGDGRDGAQTLMQARGDTHASIERIDDGADPMIRQNTACIDDTDDHGFHALGGGFSDGEIWDSAIGFAAGQAVLADAPFWPPIDNAKGGFGGELVGYVTEKEQVGLGDFHWRRSRSVKAELRG